MQAGKLDRKITIQSRSESQSATGAPVYSWSTWKTVWAKVMDLRGREYFEAHKENAEVTTKFLIRHVDGLKAEMRISYDSQIYDIEHIVKLGRRRGIEIIAKVAIE